MAQYVFGLDIGIASVGWAVLDERRVIDLGVGCLLRRRLYRRAWYLIRTPTKKAECSYPG